MRNDMGSVAPEKWWADQRAKRRTVVLVIVLVFYGWLTISAQMTPLEAAAMMLLTGLAAGVVLDRVVDGTRPTVETAMLHQLIDGTTGRP